MENFSKNALIIRPTNMIPSGAWAFGLWTILGLSIVALPLGGFLTIWIPVVYLFVIPRKYKKNMPISCVLDEKHLFVYNLKKGEVDWSVSWGDIDGLYYLSTHWSTPRNVGFRLNNYDNLRASMEKAHQPGSLSAKISKLSTNKFGMIAARMLTKCEAMIPYYNLDRSPQDFATLVYSYMHMHQINGWESALEEEAEHSKAA